MEQVESFVLFLILVEHSSIVGGKENLYNHSRNQYGSFSENWETNYLRIQQYHSWVNTQRVLIHSTRTFVQQCS